MSKLLSKDAKRLNLFRNSEVIIDKTLPKYKNLEKENDDDDPDRININSYIAFLDGEKRNTLESILSNEVAISDMIKGEKNAEKFNLTISSRLVELMRKQHSSMGMPIFDGEETLKHFSSINDEKETLIQKLGKKLHSLLSSRKNKKDEEPEKVYTLSIPELFSQVKVISGQEREFKERLNTYLSLINKSSLLHQDAQTEKLILGLVTHVYESVLAVSGFNHYIEMDDLVKLQLECEKELDLDYVKNFTRIIPDEVIERKLIADSLQVFDNYVILYYDPSGRSFSLTEEEEKIKKDPIMFGVIYGSTRLYYIADWIDEYCDLTLEKVIEILGEDKTL